MEIGRAKDEVPQKLSLV